MTEGMNRIETVLYAIQLFKRMWSVVCPDVALEEDRVVREMVELTKLPEREIREALKK